jgi:hypothetical protein
MLFYISISVSRMMPSTRRRGRPILAQVQGRPVLVINNGGSINPRSRVFSRPIQVAGRNNHVVQNNALIELLGIAPSSVGSRRTVGLSHQPPGVSFIGNQRLSRNHAQIILPQSIPIVSNHLLQSQTPVSQIGLIAGNKLSSVLPSVAANPSPSTNTIPGLTGLTIGGVTPKGELIIQGPGGSITIGPELLTGIQRRNAFPLFTEFEEMEQEVGMRGPGAVKNSVMLTEPGRGSIVIAKGPKTSASSSAMAGGAVASSSASSSSSSASSSASSSSSSASSSASASASSATAGGIHEPAVALGNGITVESGGTSGRVIRIGDNGAAEQVITMGGVGNGGSAAAGLHVPGNATFIVGG